MSREMDAEVAEKVLGWHHDYRFSQTHAEYWRDSSNEIVAGGDWSPTSDPAADYSVLQHVRSKWDVRALHRFRVALDEAWQQRARSNAHLIWRLDMYFPGDYARAALASLAAMKETDHE